MIRVQSERDAEIFTTNYSGDLSLGGMFIKTFTPKPVGTAVNIQLPLPRPPGYVEIQGKVVYKQEHTTDGIKAGMGVRFLDLNADARYALQQFIDGTWRCLFEKTAMISCEEETLENIMRIIDFLSSALAFRLGF